MAKQKLFRYDAITELPNTLERKNYKIGDYSDLRGNWNTRVFKNDKPIILELASGKGDYSLALAEMFPENNYIAMDVKGDRLFKGAKEALEAGLHNIRFFRAMIDHIENYFQKDEISEIWITFPDPYLSVSKEKKRLTHPRFLERYKKILSDNASINLKTDSLELYEFTKEVIQVQGLKLKEDISDIYAMTMVPDILNIQTFYERKHLAENRTITYLKFAF